MCWTPILQTGERVSQEDEDPPAQASVDGVVQGTTPLVIKLPRKQQTSLVQLVKEGCTPQSVEIDRRFSSWYLGNIIFGGIIGLVVDAADGAMWRRSPESVNARLECPVNAAPHPTTVVPELPSDNPVPASKLPTQD